MSSSSSVSRSPGCGGASDVAGELGFIAAGTRPGRADARERILAVLVGLGAHDVYVAGQVYQRALAAGVGQRVRLRQEEVSR